MAAEYTGGCRCGAIRYVARPAVPLRSYACHCTDCQAETGSGFAFQQWLRADELEVSGELLASARIKPDGARLTLYACPVCLSRIYSSNDRRPDHVVLRGGTRDDSNRISPDFHIWTASRQPWVTIPEETPRWAGGLPPDEFTAALGADGQ